MRLPSATPWISYCSAGRPPTRSRRGAETCLPRRPRVSEPTPVRAKRSRLVARSALSSVTTIRYWCRSLLPSSTSASSFSSILDQLLGTAIRQVRSVAVTHFMLTLGLAAGRWAVTVVVGPPGLMRGARPDLKTTCTIADRPISPATTATHPGVRRRWRWCRDAREGEDGSAEGGDGGGHVAIADPPAPAAGLALAGRPGHGRRGGAPPAERAREQRPAGHRHDQPADGEGQTHPAVVGPLLVVGAFGGGAVADGGADCPGLHDIGAALDGGVGEAQGADHQQSHPGDQADDETIQPHRTSPSSVC